MSLICQSNVMTRDCTTEVLELHRSAEVGRSLPCNALFSIYVLKAQRLLLTASIFVLQFCPRQTLSKLICCLWSLVRDLNSCRAKRLWPPYKHLHCHLKECVIDCRPVHAFWCFSFERFNGILGAMQVNGKSVELQLMCELLAGQFVWDVKFLTEFQENFLPFFAQGHDLSESVIVKNATELN